MLSLLIRSGEGDEAWLRDQVMNLLAAGHETTTTGLAWVMELLAWHPDKRVRTVSIALPFLLFIQAILGGAGRWGGAFHPLVAFVLLAAFGWLSRRLWEEKRAADTAASVTAG